MDVSGGENKVHAIKDNVAQELGIGTMIPGKLDVVKKETARMTIHILGIRELK